MPDVGIAQSERSLEQLLPGRSAGRLSAARAPSLLGAHRLLRRLWQRSVRYDDGVDTLVGADDRRPAARKQFRGWLPMMGTGVLDDLRGIPLRMAPPTSAKPRARQPNLWPYVSRRILGRFGAKVASTATTIVACLTLAFLADPLPIPFLSDADRLTLAFLADLLRSPFCHVYRLTLAPSCEFLV
jgi:hypothetical protein